MRVLFIAKSSSHTRRDDCVYQESTRCSTKGVGREGSVLHNRVIFVQRTQVNTSEDSLNIPLDSSNHTKGLVTRSTVLFVP